MQQVIDWVSCETCSHLVLDRHCLCLVSVLPAFLQTMCSYLTTSSAWPVLLRHRKLLVMAAGMLLHGTSMGNEGDWPSPRQPFLLPLVALLAVTCMCAHENSLGRPVFMTRTALLSMLSSSGIRQCWVPSAGGTAVTSPFKSADAADACVPGAPNQPPRPFLEVLCTHAAACDLAIADAGFRSAVVASNITVMALLHTTTSQAHKYYPRNLDTEGWHALMEFQDIRLMAAGVKVRYKWPL